MKPTEKHRAAPAGPELDPPQVTESVAVRNNPNTLDLRLCLKKPHRCGQILIVANTFAPVRILGYFDCVPFDSFRVQYGNHHALNVG